MDDQTPNVKKAKAPKRRAILAVAAIVVLAGGGAAAYVALSGKAANLAESIPFLSSVASHEAAPNYYEMPEMLVTLGPRARARYLRIKIILESSSDMSAHLSELQPRLVDSLQTFLRSLDEYDLEGAASIQRLRSEIVRRARAVAGREAVSNALIVDLILQ